jgi:hypothetical protein
VELLDPADEGKEGMLTEGTDDKGSLVEFLCRKLGLSLAAAKIRGERLGEILFQSLGS